MVTKSLTSKFLVVCSLATFLLPTFGLFAQSPTPHPLRIGRRPNPGGINPPTIILMISDDQFYSDFGFAGNPAAYTPTLDGLVAEGVIFPVGHVSMSRCRPSLASLLSGRYPHQTGIYYNTTAPPDLQRPLMTLPGLLTDAGYTCWAGGKYWEGDPSRLGFVSGEKGLVRKNQLELDHFLAAAGDKPAFIWWAPSLPHFPFNAPRHFRELIRPELVERPSYIPAEDEEEWRENQVELLANVAWLDQGARRLLFLLRKHGRLDNTLIVFLVDNGFTYGLPSKGAPTEAGLRTPVVLWDPNRIRNGMRRNELVSSLDLVPTILEWAGLPPAPEFAGRSLWPLIEGEETPWRDALYGAVYGFQPTDAENPRPEQDIYALYARTQRWKYIIYLRSIKNTYDARRLGISTFRSPVHDGTELFDKTTEKFRQKFLQYEFSHKSAGEEALYDLISDPDELHNLAAEQGNRALVERLRAGVFDWWESTGGGTLPFYPEDMSNGAGAPPSDGAILAPTSF